MPKISTLAAAALVAGLTLTGCGSEESDQGSTSDKEASDETTESAPAPLDATSARALSEKLLSAVNCTQSEFASAEELEKTNKEQGVALLDSAFCGVEEPKKVAYFVSIGKDEADFDTVADYFDDQGEKDEIDLETEDVRGDGWQVLVMAQDELPADIDDQEDALKEAAGR